MLRASILKVSFATFASLTTALVGLAVLAPTAQAAPIVYTFSGTATGTLGGISFEGSSFAFNLTGDSDNVQEGVFAPGIYSSLPLSASFVVNGTSGNLTNFVYLFDNHNLSAVGFGELNTETPPLIDMGNALFGSYDLRGPIGPVGGTLNVNGVNSIGTSSGALTFTQINGPTFAAVGGVVVPEAGTLALALPAVGMLGAVVLRRRKK